MKRKLVGCILAGGYGSRVKNLVGDCLPKSMLPIGERQLLIDVAVQKLRQTAVDPIIIAFGYRGLPLVHYVSDVFSERKILFWRDRDIQGPTRILTRIHQAIFRDDEVDIVVIPSDQVYDFNLEPAIESHLRTRAQVTEITVLPNVGHCKKVVAPNGSSVSVIGQRIVGSEFLRWLPEDPRRLTSRMLDLSFEFAQSTRKTPNIFTYSPCVWEDLGEEDRYTRFINTTGKP